MRGACSPTCGLGSRLGANSWRLEPASGFSDPALVGEPGSSYEGRRIFPWGYGVVLANISRRAFEAADLGNIIPAGRVICQDDFEKPGPPIKAFGGDMNWHSGATEKGKRSGATLVGIASPQLDRVRWHLFPEIRVSQGTFDLESPSPPRVETVPECVRVMGLRYSRFANSISA